MMNDAIRRMRLMPRHYAATPMISPPRYMPRHVNQRAGDMKTRMPDARVMLIEPRRACRDRGAKMPRDAAAMQRAALRQRAKRREPHER